MRARSTTARGTTAILAAAVLALTACGGDDDDGGDGGSSSSGSSGGGSSASGEAFDMASIQALLDSVSIPGYTAAPDPAIRASSATVTFTGPPTGEDAELSALVNLSDCDPFICNDFDPNNLTEQEVDNLKSSLSRNAIENPDLIFEFGEVELAPGQTGFFTYARSLIIDGPSKSAANRYTASFNDGTNSFTVLVTARGAGVPDTEEALAAELDQAKGEAEAKKVFAGFASAFDS